MKFHSKAYDLMDVHENYFVLYILSVVEILHKVKAGHTPPFRPSVSADSCSDEVRALMMRCWDENPEARPSSKSLLAAGKALNK